MGLPNSRSFGFSLAAAGNWTGDAGDRLDKSRSTGWGRKGIVGIAMINFI